MAGRFDGDNLVFVVEPTVNEEKLLSLLAQQCELPQLDYKEAVNLKDHRARIELAKDVAAMRAHGGYIVIGVDDGGEPSDLFTAELAAMFDEANLRPQLEKYLPPTGVHCARHEIEGNHYVLIYIPQHEDGFTVVHRLGEYDKPGGQKSQVVLRPGDVFVRHGTSSERWKPEDVPIVTAARDVRLREAHRADFAATVAAVQTGVQGQEIASGPVQGLSWQLDQATFDSTTIELLRREDLVPIRLFLIRTPGEARQAATMGDNDSFGVLLDRLITLAATALTVGQRDIANQVIEQLHVLYNNPPASGDATAMIRSSRYWLEIASRVEALGGLATALNEWAVVRQLVLRSPSGNGDYYSSWLRHGLTEAARGNAYPTTDGTSPRGAMIPMAREHTHRVAALRPYAVDDSRHDPQGNPDPDDTILDAICQFDALAALIVSTLPGKKPRGSQFYPGFANYYSQRSEPAWLRTLMNSEMRSELFPEVDDAALGGAMNFVTSSASRGDVNPYRLWEINDATLEQFMNDNTDSTREQNS